MLTRRAILEAAGAALLSAGGPACGAVAGVAAGPYSWKSVNFGAGGFIDGFVFHPREAGLLYARTDIGGAYRFDAASQSWLPLLDHLGKDDAELMGVLSLAIDPSDPQRLYAACGLNLGEWARKAALLASNDRGATWQATELGLRLGGNAPGRGTGERLQVSPHDGRVLLLGTSQDGLMKSGDRGASFSRLDFPGRHLSLVLFDPGAPDTLLAGCHDRPGLYVSKDGGRHFEREAGTPEQVPQRAVFAADGTLFVSFALGDGQVASNPGNAKAGGVWKRDAGSGRWTEITPVRTAGFGWSGLDVDARDPRRIVVSTIERWSEGDDLFLSTDGGLHWTALGTRSRHDASRHPWLRDYTHGQDRMGHWIADLKIDPFDGQRMVYGTGYGLWITHNLGAARVDWDFTVANLEETATLEIHSPSGGATLLAAMGDVSGGAWDDVGKSPQAGLFSPSNQTHRSVDSAALNPAIVARTSDSGEGGGYLSIDGGVSWRGFGPSPRAKGDAGRIAVSARGSALLWVPDRQPALFSRDRGRSWAVSEGWPATRDVSLLPVADRTVDGVFYVHDRANGQILVSVDAGTSFKPAITGLPALQSWQPAQLVCAAGKLRDLWLALPDALLHLPGPDQPAKTIRGVAEPWLIALGKAAPGATEHSLYIWGRVMKLGVPVEGLYRSDDGGNSFMRLNDDAHRYGRLLSMAADPLEHGTLYIAPHGRGVLVGRPAA